GDDAKGADRGEDPALGAVDLVHTIALSHWLALTTTRQVEVLREHIARVARVRMIAFAAATTAAASVDAVAAVPAVATQVVPLQHSFSCHRRIRLRSVVRTSSMRKWADRGNSSSGLVGS